MKLYTLRIKPGQDLRQTLQDFAHEQHIQAGFIITCAGALKKLSIRLAGATPDNQPTKDLAQDLEIVSLTGTITHDDCHLHIAASDADGAVIGGHLRAGTIVDVTAEVVIGEDEAVVYTREPDAETGFEELVVKQRQT